jgi:hypothetical protein
MLKKYKILIYFKIIYNSIINNNYNKLIYKYALKIRIYKKKLI